MLWNFHISGDIYNGTDYFIVGFKDIDMNGLRVRVRSR